MMTKVQCRHLSSNTSLIRVSYLCIKYFQIRHLVRTLQPPVFVATHYPNYGFCDVAWDLFEYLLLEKLVAKGFPLTYKWEKWGKLLFFFFIIYKKRLNPIKNLCLNLSKKKKLESLIDSHFLLKDVEKNVLFKILMIKTRRK